MTTVSQQWIDRAEIEFAAVDPDFFGTCPEHAIIAAAAAMIALAIELKRYNDRAETIGEEPPRIYNISGIRPCKFDTDPYTGGDMMPVINKETTDGK